MTNEYAKTIREQTNVYMLSLQRFRQICDRRIAHFVTYIVFKIQRVSDT